MSVGYWSKAASMWIAGTVSTSPTVGGFLYATLASIGLGVLVSTVRWMTVDAAAHRLGVRPSKVEFSTLRDRHQAMSMLIDGHYRYYQFHGNLLVALPISLTLRWSYVGFSIGEFTVLFIVLAVLALGATDALKKYYRRTSDLLEN